MPQNSLVMIGSGTSLASHKERADRIDRFLDLCRKRGWTDYTPDIARKIDAFLAPDGFTEKTVRDYTRAIVMQLSVERNTTERRQREDDALEDAVVELVYQENLKK